MTTGGDSEQQIVAQLKATLASGALAPSARQRGQAILARLTSPVRIAILGLPGAGKTELMNLIAGRRVVPADVKFPSFELSGSPDIRCYITDVDEVEVETAWPVATDLDWSGSTMVRLEYPLPGLGNIALIEVVTDGTDEDLALAAEWAAGRADIALWCAQEFGPAEQAAWKTVPDVLKDHSFLVVTKADLLVAAGMLVEQISVLTDLVADDFHSLIPVATLQFLNAIEKSGSVPAKVRAASGAAALIDEVLYHATQGRQSDLDGAMYFLSRYGVDGQGVDAALEPAPNRVVDPADSQEDTAEWLRTARDHIFRRGAELFDLSSEMDELAEGVLAHCSETLGHLVEKSAAKNATSEALQDELEEAAEMLILLGLEGGDEPAADAATVVLQLAREYAVKAAA